MFVMTFSEKKFQKSSRTINNARKFEDSSRTGLLKTTRDFKKKKKMLHLIYYQLYIFLESFVRAPYGIGHCTGNEFESYLLFGASLIEQNKKGRTYSLASYNSSNSIS